MSLSCNVCSRSFSTSQALQQHERDSPRHLSSSGEHVSQAIGRSQVQTKQNKASSRPPPQHQFRCLTCQRSFNSNQALEQHKRDSPRHAGGAHQQQNIQPPASNTPTSTQQQQSPPNRSEATYVCGPCNRSFASEEALQQHRRDSAAHQTSPTPLDIFFRSFPGFPYEPVLPPATSYAQLEQHQGWAPHSAASRDAWRQYQEALRDELQMWYGEEDDLTAWHALCRAIGVNPLPGTCEQCVMAVRNTHVNIIDLIEWGRNDQQHAGRRARTFPTVAKLREYSKSSNKIYSNSFGEDEDGNVVMRHLLRKFFRGGP